MAEPKTRANDSRVAGFLARVESVRPLTGFSRGRSCLHVSELSKIDQTVPARLIRKSVAHHRKQWPAR